MKIIIIIILSFSYNLFPAGSNSGKELSPLTRFFIDDYKELEFEELKSKYMIYNIDEINYVGAMLIRKQNFNKKILEENGYIIGAEIENIVSIKIPFDDFINFVNKNNSYSYLEIDGRVSINLDKAQSLSNDNNVIENIINAADFPFNNTVVGIIDFGFYYKHQMFLDKNNNTRIFKAWNQNASGATRPRKYNYGYEFNPNSSGSPEYDVNIESHATHVTGIAAGSSFFKNQNIKGVASNALVISVTPMARFDDFVSTGHSNIIDAISYIVSEAKSMGRAVVINISLGHHIGPHDGSAIFDQACNTLSGAGVVIVTSAGNSGNENTTLIRDFKKEPSPKKSIIQLFKNSTQANSIFSYIDAWNIEGNDFCLRLGTISKNNNIKYTNAICTNSNLQSNYYIDNNTYKVNFKVISTNSSFNKGKRIFIEVDYLSGNGYAFVEIASGKGKVFIWNCGQGGSQAGEFISDSRSGFVNGSNSYQIGEIGGNADSVITVGSYTSRSTFKNYKQQTINTNLSINTISNFSSRGPSANEKLKPNISAPGSSIISAYNSQNSEAINAQAQNNPIIDFGTYNGKTHYVGVMDGTSMSSPFVAGVVSLMLTVNPYLGPSDIMKIIQETAINDEFTGDIRELGSTNWGYGKINIFDAVNISESKLEEYNVTPNFKFYPNPVKDYLYLEFQKNPVENMQVRLIDAQGKIHLDKYYINPSEEIVEVPLINLAPGIYFLELKSQHLHKTINLIKDIY